MKTCAKVLLLSTLLVALTGCASWSGKWTFQSIKPESAREAFHLDGMCLMNDGTYKAWAADKTFTGTWKHDQAAKTLTFVTEGKERVYNAKLLCPGCRMKLWGQMNNQEWTAVMKRSGSCPKNCCEKCCAKCKCADCGNKAQACKCGCGCGTVKQASAQTTATCDPAKCDKATCPMKTADKATAKKTTDAKPEKTKKG